LSHVSVTIPKSSWISWSKLEMHDLHSNGVIIIIIIV